MRRPLALAAALVLAGASGAAVQAAPAPRTFTIAMDRMAFGPAPAGLKAGDVIVWENRDIFRHTATARDGAFNVDLPPKAKARTVLRRGGRIAYYCKYHPGMTGQLVVAG